MGKFIRGFVIGIILGQLLAPMRGQEMRHVLSERMQKLLGYLPGNMLVKQSAQQVMEQASQVASDVKNNVQQVTPQIKDAAEHLSTTVQQATTKMKQTGKDAVVSEERNTPIDPLDRMKGVPPEVREKLEAEGIQSTPQLLENAQTQAERAELANKVGVSHRVLREFTYRADLMRLTNLGEDVANLLEEAGVNGCQDLQQRNPEHLHARLLKMRESDSSVSPVLEIEQITKWIAEAKEMTQIVRNS